MLPRKPLLFNGPVFGEGYTTTYGGTALSFDPENRITAFGSAMSAGYNGDGLRAWKQTSTTRAYFLYDGILPVAELDSSGNITATNTFGSFGLVSRRGTTSVFYSYDSEGNVSQRTDAGGIVLSNHQITAHGTVLTGALNEPFGYMAQFGYYTDIETSLQILTNRYYDPSTGRFVTRDPIGYAGGINLYTYVYNRPTMLSDLNGTVPGWDHFWFYYYSKKCADSGIQAANAVNDPNQSAEGQERMAQEAFDRGVGSISGLRFKIGYADNDNCRQMEFYGGKLYGDSFPTNVQRVAEDGSLCDTAGNIAKTQVPSKAGRLWNWVKSLF